MTAKKNRTEEEKRGKRRGKREGKNGYVSIQGDTMFVCSAIRFSARARGRNEGESNTKSQKSKHL